jgi:glycosyltransferase involved in cell wall biosynthesis
MSATEQNPLVLANNAISMARAMRNLGRPARAVAKYDDAIAALPEFSEALDECLAVLESIEDWQGVADRCASWVELFPDHATNADADRIHSRRVDALCRLGGIEAALDAYGLEPVARTETVIGSDEILAVIGLRDEFPRLLQVLAHHRRLGVDRFLIIDNGSTDGSLEFLIDQPDTIVWRTDASYRAANCGAVWWDLLLRRHAQGNWCLVIDADEYFIFPNWETRRLRDLCTELDARKVTCYPAVFLDMYGPGRLSDSVIEPGRDLLDMFRFFDRNWYRRQRGLAGPRRNLLNHWGGVRARIFGDRGLGSYLLDKVPLFRHQPGDVLLSGNHWTNRPSAEISDGRGVLLHFKYDAGFAALIAREVERGEHAGAARAYRLIADELQVDADPQFFDPIYSVRYENSEQLLRFGIMRTENADSPYPNVLDQVVIPEISEIPGIAGDSSPFWSVVVLAHRTDIGRQLDEVLRCLVGEPASEIRLVVTADAPDASAILPESGAHQIHLDITPLHLTDLEALNHGIRAARGRWVHVLDLDAAVDPAVYREARAIIEGISSDDGVGSGLDAVIMGVDAATSSDLPLGLPLNLPVASVLARRDCFTSIGGFATTIAGAAGWEFAQRATDGAAERIAGLTTSTVAPRSTRTPSAQSATIDFGREIAHGLMAIDLVAHRGRLDPTAVQQLLDRCATDASARIVQDLERGAIGSAFSVLAEILRAPISDDARRTLVQEFSRRMR